MDPSVEKQRRKIKEIAYVLVLTALVLGALSTVYFHRIGSKVTGTCETVLRIYCISSSLILFLISLLKIILFKRNRSLQLLCYLFCLVISIFGLRVVYKSLFTLPY